MGECICISWGTTSSSHCVGYARVVAVLLYDGTSTDNDTAPMPRVRTISRDCVHGQGLLQGLVGGPT